MKKFLVVMMIAIFLVTSACNVNAENTLTLQLESNEYNSNGERHIKVTWQAGNGTTIIQLSDNEQFQDAIEKKRTSKQGAYYNFVLQENVDATYYIRVRSVDGEWSNVVVADAENKIESESTPYIPTPELPEIPDVSENIQVPDVKFDLSKLKFDLSKIDWSKYF